MPRHTHRNYCRLRSHGVVCSSSEPVWLRHVSVSMAPIAGAEEMRFWQFHLRLLIEPRTLIAGRSPRDRALSQLENLVLVVLLRGVGTRSERDRRRHSVRLCLLRRITSILLWLSHGGQRRQPSWHVAWSDEKNPSPARLGP